MWENFPIFQINMVYFSVAQYYSHLALTKKFNLLPTDKDHMH